MGGESEVSWCEHEVTDWRVGRRDDIGGGEVGRGGGVVGGVLRGFDLGGRWSRPGWTRLDRLRCHVCKAQQGAAAQLLSVCCRMNSEDEVDVVANLMASGLT